MLRSGGKETKEREANATENAIYQEENGTQMVDVDMHFPDEHYTVGCFIFR